MTPTIPESEWEWFGLAGHFICADRCQFHMTTKVGNVLVSTIGQYYQNREDKEMTAIGCDRFFETMVFTAGERCKIDTCQCNMPTIDWDAPGFEGAFEGYQTAGEATKGHMRMCHEWAKLSKQQETNT